MNGMMLLTWKKGLKTVNIQIYNLRQRRRETDRRREREGFKKIKTERERQTEGPTKTCKDR
jgi:hypothetical protein